MSRGSFEEGETACKTKKLVFILAAGGLLGDVSEVGGALKVAVEASRRSVGVGVQTSSDFGEAVQRSGGE